MIKEFESTELTIQSDIEQISLVENFIDTLAEEYKIEEDIYGNIMIAVTEAVNNSISHGNNNEPNKTVKIVAQLVKPFLLSVTVFDEGKGFKIDEIKDPTSFENLLSENGRGIFVMKHLADELIFHNNGSGVEMRFQL